MEISDENTPLAASSFVGDQSRPQLQSFVLDLTQEELSLTFSETVKAESFQIPFVKLLNGDGVLYTLEDSSSSEQDSTSIVISLSSHDLNEIKKLDTLWHIKQRTVVLYTLTMYRLRFDRELSSLNTYRLRFDWELRSRRRCSWHLLWRLE